MQRQDNLLNIQNLQLDHEVTPEDRIRIEEIDT